LGWLHQQGRQPPAGCRGVRAVGGSLNPEEDGFDLNCALRHGEVVYLRSDSTDPELVIPLKAVARGVAMYFEPGWIVRTIRTIPVRTTQAHNFARDERSTMGSSYHDMAW